MHSSVLTLVFVLNTHGSIVTFCLIKFLFGQQYPRAPYWDSSGGICCLICCQVDRTHFSCHHWSD